MPSPYKDRTYNQVTSTVIPYHFTQPKSDVVTEMNKELPLNLQTLEPLINRVAKRYPYIPKSDVTRIIKTFIEKMRDLLVMGESFSVNGLMQEMKLRFYPFIKFSKVFPAVKVRLTSPEIR